MDVLIDGAGELNSESSGKSVLSVQGNGHVVLCCVILAVISAGKPGEGREERER
jgi:hypothetical protein